MPSPRLSPMRSRSNWTWSRPPCGLPRRKHAVLKAPFEGTVAARYLDPGATVHAESPVINMVRSDDLWVRFATPDTQRATLPVGSTISVHLEGLHVVIPGTIAHL